MNIRSETEAARIFSSETCRNKLKARGSERGQKLELETAAQQILGANENE